MKRKSWLFLVGYAAGALLLSYLLARLAIHDRTAEVPLLWSTCAKALLILLILYYAKVSGADKYLLCGRTFTRDALWLLLPLIASWMVYYGTPNTRPEILTFVMTLLGVVFGVVWEELYFRFLARLLFERCGKYHLLALVLTSVVYGLSQLFRAMYQPVGIGAGMMLFIFATAQGIFLTALYSKTKNILFPLCAHLLQDVAGVLFHSFSTQPMGVFGRGDIFEGLLAIVYTAVGFWFLFFSHHIRERRHKVPPVNGDADTPDQTAEPKDGLSA